MARAHVLPYKIFVYIYIYIYILTNDFFNFIEIINLLFAIKVPISVCENKVAEEMFKRLLKFM